MKKPNYQQNLKKLLAGARKSPKFTQPAGDALIELVVRSVFEEDATEAQALKALERLRAEFVDFNELRVSQSKEILERIGKDYPGGREKAEMLVASLNRIFDHTCTMTMDYIVEKHAKDPRRHLRETGLSPYAASAVALKGFDQAVAAVDDTLVGCLELDQCIEPGTAVLDAQAAIEKLITAKNALGVHQLLRAYAEKNAKALQKHRQQQQQATAKAAQEQEQKMAKKTVRGGQAQVESTGPGKAMEEQAAATKQAEQELRASLTAETKAGSKKSAAPGKDKPAATKVTSAPKAKAAKAAKAASKAAPPKTAKTAKSAPAAKAGAKAAPVKDVKKAGGTKARKRK